MITLTDDGRLVCSCLGFTGPKHRAWYLDAASGELGHDRETSASLAEVVLPRLMTVCRNTLSVGSNGAPTASVG